MVLRETWLGKKWKMRRPQERRGKQEAEGMMDTESSCLLELLQFLLLLRCLLSFPWISMSYHRIFTSNYPSTWASPRGFFFFFVTWRFLWRGLTNKWTWLCIIGGQLDSPPARNIRKESCRLCEIWNKQSSSISTGAHRCSQALPSEGTDMLVRNVGWKREGLPSTDWPGTGGRSSLAFVLPVPTEKWKSYFPNKVRTGPDREQEGGCSVIFKTLYIKNPIVFSFCF